MTFCLTSGGAGSDALMPLTMRPTGLGSGIDKDRQDYTIYSGEWAVGRMALITALVLVVHRHLSDGALWSGADLGGGQGAVSKAGTPGRRWVKLEEVD